MHAHAIILEGGLHVRGCPSVHGESAGFLQSVRLPKEDKTKRLRCVVGDFKTYLLNSFQYLFTQSKKIYIYILHNALNSFLLNPR